MKVLLLEDEPAVVNYRIAILKRYEPSIEIDSVENGDDALRLYLEMGPYDLVITDHGHPGLFGIELIDKIRAVNSAQAVILQTGNYGDHIDAFQQKYKDIPLLSKGYRSKDLESLVDRLKP